MAATLAFTFLFIYLVQVRYKIRKVEDDVIELKRAAGAGSPTTSATPGIIESGSAS